MRGFYEGKSWILKKYIVTGILRGNFEFEHSINYR